MILQGLPALSSASDVGTRLLKGEQRLWNGPPLSPASVMMLWCEKRKERAYEHHDPWN